jgi:hypothetical protein
MSLSAFDDKWVFSTDTNDSYRANGTNFTKNKLDNLTNISTSTSTQLSINMGTDKSTLSDFSIGCIIVFDRTLSNNEITQVENWLSLEYSNLWKQTYTKTFAQLGYSCFDNKIGKVTDNYSKYELASYKNGTLGCEWLDLPEKNNFKPLSCDSVTNINYEPFTTFTLDINIDLIFYLLIIILIIVLVCKKSNK